MGCLNKLFRNSVAHKGNSRRESRKQKQAGETKQQNDTACYVALLRVRVRIRGFSGMFKYTDTLQWIQRSSLSEMRRTEVVCEIYCTARHETKRVTYLSFQ